MIDYGKAYAFLDDLDPRITPIRLDNPEITGYGICQKRILTLEIMITILRKDDRNKLRFRVVEILNILQDWKKQHARKD